MILMESDMSIRRSARLSPRFRARIAALLGAIGGLLVLGGCGVTRTKEGARAAPAGNEIERTAEKGPVKLFVSVWPRQPRLSDLVEMEVRVETQPHIEIKPPAFGQAVGDFLIRDYNERPPESGARHHAPLPLPVRTDARRQTPDPVGGY